MPQRCQLSAAAALLIVRYSVRQLPALHGSTARTRCDSVSDPCVCRVSFGWALKGRSLLQLGSAVHAVYTLRLQSDSAMYRRCSCEAGALRGLVRSQSRVALRRRQERVSWSGGCWSVREAKVVTVAQVGALCPFLSLNSEARRVPTWPCASIKCSAAGRESTAVA